MAKITFDSEKELEDYIFDYMGQYKYSPITGENVSFCERQVKLGPYGVIDILATDISSSDKDEFEYKVTYTVLELKKQILNTKSVSQISRYILGLSNHLCDSNLEYEWEICGELIAIEIDHQCDTGFLIDIANGVNSYLVEFDLDNGISFKHKLGWGRDGDCADFDDGINANILRFLKENKTLAKEAEVLITKDGE